MKARRNKDEVYAILTKYSPHCREDKRHSRCMCFASLETQPMPIELKVTNKNEEVLYVTHKSP